jgi:putative Mg2+ transporter-C (MgtC) family protein
MFPFTPEDLLKIVIAIIIGGIIGLERELQSKAAGLRTITLISVGATLFTLIGNKIGDDRVAAGIVTGVGFLGGGVILFTEGRLKGLTTAASVWVAAALGMAIAEGEYILAISVAAAVMIVLILFARLDHWIDRVNRETRNYQVTYIDRISKHAELEQLIRDVGLRVRGSKRMKRGDDLISVWETEAFTREHNALTEKLLADKEIKEIKF